MLLFLGFSKPVFAQSYIPIELQLRSAYHSMSYQEFLNPSPLPVLQEFSSPSISTPQTQQQVLGASTTKSEEKIIKIAMLGDSMTDTLGPAFPKLTEALKRYYPIGINFRFMNYGKGSDTIEGGANRLIQDYEYKNQTIPNLISQSPDIIILESFAYNNFGNTQTGFDRHWLALGSIISTIKAKLPDTKIVIASTIAPNAIIFANGAPGVNYTALERLERTQTIKYYLERTIAFADSESLPLSNVYNSSLVGQNGDRLYISSTDGLHPSVEGFELIANILAKTIYDNQLVDTFN